MSERCALRRAAHSRMFHLKRRPPKRCIRLFASAQVLSWPSGCHNGTYVCSPRKGKLSRNPKTQPPIYVTAPEGGRSKSLHNFLLKLLRASLGVCCKHAPNIKHMGTWVHASSASSHRRKRPPQYLSALGSYETTNIISS